MMIPFAFYDDQYLEEAKNLSNIYHRGQEKIWDGREVLCDLFAKHSDTSVPDDLKEPLKNILTIVLWGEYVAWNVSSELSSRLEDYGAKMAAVSQSYDEARHFYVMRDYLQARLDYKPVQLARSSYRVLEEVSEVRDLPRKLLGMQLMIEPVAITIFRFLRKSNVDPVLSELLEYFEKDEARHIALGVKYLPKLIQKMNIFQLTSFLWWQIKLINHEIRGLKFLEKDLEKLGLDPLVIFEFAENKQMECLRRVAKEMNVDNRFWRPIERAVRFRKMMAFYPNPEHGRIKKLINSIFEIFKH